MSKEKKKFKKEKKKETTPLSDFLTPAQRAKYKAMGEPDPTQNWLELFTDDIVSDLFTIMRSCSDNQLKSDYIHEELAPYGFEDVGLGTNIFTMSHPSYPGVVFKIALDNFGIADNFNDCILQDIVPHYVKVFTRHPSAIVSVQQRGVLPTPDQMSVFYPRIIKLLKKLSEYFLVVDLSPKMFLNYVVDRNGDFLICDGSDLYPKHQIKNKIRCNNIVGQHRKTGEMKYCEGKLHYKEDFSALVCEKCGKEYNPLCFRPKKEVDKMWKFVMDGISAEEHEAMEQEEIAAIRARAKKQQVSELDSSEISDDSESVTVDEVAEEYTYEDTSNAEEEEDTLEEEYKSESENDIEDDDSDNDDEIITLKRSKVSEPIVVEELQNVDTESSTNEEVEDYNDDDEEKEEVVKLPLIQTACIADDTTNDHSDNDPVTSVDMQSDVKSDIENITVDDLENIIDTSPDTLISFLMKVEEIAGEDFIKAVFKEKLDQMIEASVDKTNNNEKEEGHDDAAESSPIFYRVINASEDRHDMPGIYVDINGNFNENFDDYGLGLYVSIDHGNSYTAVIRVSEMKRMLKPVIDELLEEEREMKRALEMSKNQPTQPNDEEDDSEELDEIRHEELITRTFHTNPEDEESSDSDGEDEE